MFKLHRHRSDKVAERVDFKFSDFRAIQVPKGWDNLFISIVSVETGKAITKSNKAINRNGSCLWTDSMSESIRIYQDDASKEPEECQFKIVVSMGSARSGILGESILNLTEYMGSRDSTAVSLPLKKCNYGTVLQLKIQCLSSKSKFRDGKSRKETTTHHEELSTNNDDIDSKSDGSDTMLNRSVGSSSSNRLGATYPDEHGNRDTYFSASGSHRSSDSGDSSLDKTMFSPRNNFSGGVNMGRQDSADSNVSTTYIAGHGNDLSRSNNASFSSRASGSSTPQENTVQAFPSGLSHLSSRPSDSAKDLLEAAEETIEELRDEAKMWERHSRKVKIDLEILKKECSDKSKHQADLEMELSAAHSARDLLKQEIEQLKSSLDEITKNQTNTGTPRIEDMIDVQKELEDEIKFQKESNADLTLQLKKSQESNIELVSILQELEDIIDKQKFEISRLSQDSGVTEHDEGLRNQILLGNETEWARKLSSKEQEIVMLEEKLSHVLNTQPSSGTVFNNIHSDLEKENEILRAKIQELERDCSELTDENLELIYEMKKFNKVAKEGEHSSNFGSSESGLDILKSRIHQLEGELRRKETLDEGNTDEASASKIKNLEMKCADLELKLQRFRDEACDLQKMLQKSQEELEERNKELSELRQEHESFQDISMTKESENLKRELTSRSSGISEELDGSTSEIDELKASLSVKEEEIYLLRHSKTELEQLISDFQKEKGQLEENLSIALKESSITSKCLDDVRHDLAVLTSSIDSHVSANKMLERNSMELESCKIELELHISELEHENVQLSERISGLEAQLRYLTDDKESNRLELEDSKSLIQDLKVTVERQQAEMESQKLELKQKLQEAQKRLLEAQEESEFLRRSNSKLQATAESLIEECNSLQTIAADLRMQKLELHERVTHVEMDLEESQKKSFDFCKEVELLEIKLSSLQKDISSKEKSLLLEVENIFQEHKEHEERITRAHLLLNKMETEKMIEVENLEREIAKLTSQVFSTHDEQEKISLDTTHEVSSLHSDKAKLESSLHDANAQVKLYETELQTLRQESKTKIQGLVDLLNASRQSEEMLMTDIEHMQRLNEAVKSSEEKFRKTSNELELKLKASDYEKQQIVEELSGLKVQLQKIAHLQDETLVLKSSLDEAKFAKGKLEEKLESISEECEALKTERAVLMDKISNMQKTLENGEDDRRSKIALEAKLLRMKSDLSANEASYAHETELKNEISRMKRTNSEYQRKIQSLEQEKDELMKKAQLMEKELMLKKEEDREGKFEGDKKLYNNIDVNTEADLRSRIHLLETKLAESLEANNMYELQLKSSPSENMKKDASENDMKIAGAGKLSSLEAELKDMKERFLNMSLQYAEVEAQREELVMKLKSTKKEKRWF
ncbi:uncharacterized protein [Typha angustifolia]|uniref:uncharacterized protein n=1 Tax=Typha angustifolia TaxID=59011 RepID=UPI003C2DACBC